MSQNNNIIYIHKCKKNLNFSFYNNNYCIQNYSDDENDILNKIYNIIFYVLNQMDTKSSVFMYKIKGLSKTYNVFSDKLNFDEITNKNFVQDLLKNNVIIKQIQ